MLSLLNSIRPLGVFVENRIKEMKTGGDIEFHYISKTENPVDIASRGASACALQHSILCWHGPDWMVEIRGQQ